MIQHHALQWSSWRKPAPPLHSCIDPCISTMLHLCLSFERSHCCNKVITDHYSGFINTNNTKASIRLSQVEASEATRAVPAAQLLASLARWHHHKLAGATFQGRMSPTVTERRTDVLDFVLFTRTPPVNTHIASHIQARQPGNRSQFLGLN